MILLIRNEHRRTGWNLRDAQSRVARWLTAALPSHLELRRRRASARTTQSSYEIKALNAFLGDLGDRCAGQTDAAEHSRESVISFRAKVRRKGIRDYLVLLRSARTAATAQKQW